MKQFLKILQASPLFGGIGAEDLEKILDCLGQPPLKFDTGSFIFLAGQRAERMGIVLRGEAQVIREESSGERTILTRLGPGQLFGEAFVCASGERRLLPVSVLAVKDCDVMLLDYHKMLNTCPTACRAHTRLIENMLGVLADKNLLLNRRLMHLSKRSTREKLLSYLEEQAAIHGGEDFLIPFNRQELADYLCVERSAMSAALGKMRDEGILWFERNHFILH